MEHPSRVGKYEVEKFLGGGMARVYRARDSVLGRPVALKVLAGTNAENAGAKDRFLQEARLASTTAHENIIAVYDFGEDQGCPFMVMELLEGESLRDAIKGHRTGDVARKLRIALQVARAIGHIHSKKIVHRDIKPENIHLDPVGRAKLMDFGIAMDYGFAKVESFQRPTAELTLGTPFYMSPEQVLGQDVTTQTDVYSFGVLTYELFTGIKPVQGTTVEELYDKILHQAPDMEPLHEAMVPPAAIDLIGKCLAKRAEERPRGFAIICAAMEEILGPGAIRLKPLPEPASIPAPSTNRGELPGWFEKLPATLRTPGGLMLVSAVVTLALIVLLYVLFASRL